MFLEIIQQRNPGLLEAGAFYHQQGKIDPNTYVIDVDAVAENAKIIAQSARKTNIELFFMTKQIGRNPILAHAIKEAGIEKAVAVDPWEAKGLATGGIQIGHAGHLVQIPKNMTESILHLHPSQITVFSYENAAYISDINGAMKKEPQPILLRVISKQDFLYPGQEGGILLENLEAELKRIETLSGVKVIGVTNFPCLQMENGGVEPTINFRTLQQAAELLKNKGYEAPVVNAPSLNTAETLEIIADEGGTQAEPGHALTGTTPLHAAKHQPERPAIAYVSEISHTYDQKSYVYGGGFYARSNVQTALTGENFSEMKQMDVIPNEPGTIDYYGALKGDQATVGNTALFSFRTQIFVTNAQVALIKNTDASPELMGIYDAAGNRLQ
ncbi:YhfX family PLP-dependent enzyme [Salibacterium salarium]|uniref:YhfX family PLP-dependent enzyme n=1 Tax=Salibacterium salarium TaxID=284579 RepID=A0A3R9QR06_9BACI|nr:alanine racemase [Salibacterium salarium]RSL31513.1 YhfX family PLP-dependent enzyme [Salibacterium salarium]